MSNKNPDIKNVEVDGIIVSVELPPYFISPDIEKAWNYYPKYLENALKEGKIIRTPPSYLNNILAQVGETGSRRDEIMKHYSQYVGSRKALDQMEEAWRVFKEAKGRGVYIRFTDAAQRLEVHPIDKALPVVKEKLEKGESIMLEPIMFQHDSENETITK